MNPFTDDEKAMTQEERMAEFAKFPKGTVGAVALDKFGMLACATSTGGKTNKNGEWPVF